MQTFDIIAIGIILFFGILGFSGWLRSITGLLFGIFAGIIVVGIMPFFLAKYNIGFHPDITDSVIMKYLGNLASYITHKVGTDMHVLEVICVR